MIHIAQYLPRLTSKFSELWSTTKKYLQGICILTHPKSTFSENHILTLRHVLPSQMFIYARLANAHLIGDGVSPKIMSVKI